MSAKEVKFGESARAAKLEPPARSWPARTSYRRRDHSPREQSTAGANGHMRLVHQESIPKAEAGPRNQGRVGIWES